MIPPEDYSGLEDEAQMMLTLAINDEGEVGWQINRRGTDEEPPISHIEAVMLMELMHKAQLELLSKLQDNMMGRMEESDYKVDEELE